MGKGGAKQEVNEYRMSLHYGVCLAPPGGVTFKRITIADKVIWEGSVNNVSYVDINLPDLFGGPKKEGGVGGRIYFLPGKPNQVMPAELAGRLRGDNGEALTPATCPAFRGVASVYFIGNQSVLAGPSNLYHPTGRDYSRSPIYNGGFFWTANSPFIQAVKITVEVGHNELGYTSPFIGPNINPACLLYECLVSQSWGMGAPPYLINRQSFLDFADLMVAEAFGLSLMWRDQSTVEDFASEIIDHTQATVFVDPRDGLLNVKALRADYDIETLRELNPDNARMKNFERKLWGETVNEMVVTWTNPDNEQTETVTDQDLGNVAIQGGVISDNRDYYAVRSAELARRLLDRDLRTASAPLASFQAEVDRSFYDVVPGGLVRVNWPRHQLSNIVCRVMRVEYGKKRDSKIKLTLLEDIFSLTKPLPTVPPSTNWTGTAETPAPMDNVQIITLPQYLAQREVSTLGVVPTYPEVFAGVLAYRDSVDTIAYDLLGEAVDAAGTEGWTSLGTKSVLGRAIMLTPLYQEAVSEIAGLPLIGVARGPEVSSLAFVGGGADADMEIMLLRAFDPDTNTWTVDRGVLDTVPRYWPVETPVWFYPLSAVIADDLNLRSAGEVVNYKLRTRTSQSTLPFEDTPTNSGTMTARPWAPLRPANVKINGVAFGEVDATGQSELTITWATRNRLFEDGPITRWDAGAVTPEYKQHTVVTVYRENGTVMFYKKGLYVENSLVIPIAHVQQESKVFIRVSSEREGIGSIQSHALWVKNIPYTATPAAPPPSDDGGTAPPPPDPDPEPTPEELPGVEPTPPSGGQGGGGAREWGVHTQSV